MSRNYHPDKWAAATPSECDRLFFQDCFCRINRAHSVLSDANQRQLYDRHGEASLDPDFEGGNDWIFSAGGFRQEFCDGNNGSGWDSSAGQNWVESLFQGFVEVGRSISSSPPVARPKKTKKAGENNQGRRIKQPPRASSKAAAVRGAANNRQPPRATHKAAAVRGAADNQLPHTPASSPAVGVTPAPAAPTVDVVIVAPESPSRRSHVHGKRNQPGDKASGRSPLHTCGQCRKGYHKGHEDLSDGVWYCHLCWAAWPVYS